MSPHNFLGERVPSPEMPDYQEQLRAMAVEEELPEDALSEQGLGLATELLEEMRDRYGDPASEAYNQYHNDRHALNVIKRSWRLWKALRERLPERFDEDGFELLMIAGAGHDIVYDRETAIEQPGHNEEASAAFVRDRMIDHGYSGQDSQRVYNAIRKTAVRRDETGVLLQPEMRRGDKGIMGLILGQADMNGVLLEGPATLISDAFDIYLEYTDTPLKNAVRHTVGIANFLLDEEKYLRDRVQALPDDLAYYVHDETEREIIKQVYWNEFHSASLTALAFAERLRMAPDATRHKVEAAVSTAGRVAQRGLERVAIIERLKRHLIDHRDQDSAS